MILVGCSCAAVAQPWSSHWPSRYRLSVTFVAMAALGRSLNVISLAGIAFAVGMVVDAAIRGVREHLSPAPARTIRARCGLRRRTPSVGRCVCLRAYYGDGVYPNFDFWNWKLGSFSVTSLWPSRWPCLLSLLVAVTVVPALSKSLLAGEISAKPLAIPGLDHLARCFVAVVTGFLHG